MKVKALGLKPSIAAKSSIVCAFLSFSSDDDTCPHDLRVKACGHSYATVYALINRNQMH